VKEKSNFSTRTKKKGRVPNKNNVITYFSWINQMQNSVARLTYYFDKVNLQL
jgi:hypothetical protein